MPRELCWALGWCSCRQGGFSWQINHIWQSSPWFCTGCADIQVRKAQEDRWIKKRYISQARWNQNNRRTHANVRQRQQPHPCSKSFNLGWVYSSSPFSQAHSGQAGTSSLASCTHSAKREAKAHTLTSLNVKQMHKSSLNHPQFCFLLPCLHPPSNLSPWILKTSGAAQGFKQFTPLQILLSPTLPSVSAAPKPSLPGCCLHAACSLQAFQSSPRLVQGFIDSFRLKWPPQFPNPNHSPPHLAHWPRHPVPHPHGPGAPQGQGLPSPWLPVLTALSEKREWGLSQLP